MNLKEEYEKETGNSYENIYDHYVYWLEDRLQQILNKDWVVGNNPPYQKMVKAKISSLNLQDQIITGYIGDDGFYFFNGGELSNNWKIIEWKLI